MSTTSEALFQEHWRRFFLSPQVDSAAVRRISGSFYWNDQLLWSLGVIPWGAWRLPFQKSILRFLHEALPHAAARLYTPIHTTLATAHGEFLSLPGETDRQKLVHRMEHFCEGKTSAHLIRQIQSLASGQSFFRNATLESLLRRISTTYQGKIRQREYTYYASLFHFRVLNAFLESLAPLLSGEDQAIRNSVALLSWLALFDAAPEPIQLFPQKRIMADTGRISGEIYNFWSWQYTYRNREYQKLRATLEPFLHEAGPIAVVPRIPVSNVKEYQTIAGRPGTGDGWSGELFAVCNQAIDAMVKKFDYYPAWPIVDYTSDFILGRMLSGRFHYWERENPPPKVSHENNFRLCPRDAARCPLEGRKTLTASDGKRQFPVCAPDCAAAAQQREQRQYLSLLNKERGRIRAEPLHRMLGLWLRDHCQEHGSTPAEAMRALEERHFPESNPHWQPLECGTGRHLQWYDFREVMTARSTLYADYQDACRCIEAAKFLPQLRGMKKTHSTPNSKAKKRK